MIKTERKYLEMILVSTWYLDEHHTLTRWRDVNVSILSHWRIITISQRCHLNLGFTLYLLQQASKQTSKGNRQDKIYDSSKSHTSTVEANSTLPKVSSELIRQGGEDYVGVINMESRWRRTLARLQIKSNFIFIVSNQNQSYLKALC